jgi:LacI family transcriptional regulator
VNSRFRAGTAPHGKSKQRPSSKGGRAEAVKKRRPTINDIARFAGVSKKTVSRVINASPFVKEETRHRIEAIIAEHGYEPDPQARGLAFRRSFLIALIYDNPNAQFVVNMQQGVLDGLRGSGHELVVHPCHRESSTFLHDVGAFVERLRLSGVVLLPPVSENDRLTARLKELGCRYVRIASAPLDITSNLVVSNDRLGTAEAANHLVDLGHVKIGYIQGPPGFRSRRERYQGFTEALQKRGLKLSADCVTDGAYTFESGVAAAEILLSRRPRPTAIFAANDEMAAGVYQVARALSLSVPRDLSIVGFDDTPVSSRLWPPLTTVRLPIIEMGQAAARKLLSAPTGGGQAARADNEMFEPHLVIRGSTAAPGNSAARPREG